MITVGGLGKQQRLYTSSFRGLELGAVNLTLNHMNIIGLKAWEQKEVEIYYLKPKGESIYCYVGDPKLARLLLLHAPGSKKQWCRAHTHTHARNHQLPPQTHGALRTGPTPPAASRTPDTHIHTQVISAKQSIGYGILWEDRMDSVAQEQGMSDQEEWSGCKWPALYLPMISPPQITEIHPSALAIPPLLFPLKVP